MQQQRFITTNDNRTRTRTVLSEDQQKSVIDLFNAGMMIKDLSVKFGVGHVYISNIISRYYAFYDKECSCSKCNKTGIPQYRMKSEKVCFDCYFEEKSRIEQDKDRKLLYVKICEEYVGNESTVVEVARVLNTSQGIVILALKKYYGVSFRPGKLRYI